MLKHLPKVAFSLIMFPPLFVSYLATPTPTATQPPVLVAPETETIVVSTESTKSLPVGKEHYIEKVYKYAEKHGVSAGEVIRVIECESSWHPEVQSKHTYNQAQISRNPDWGNVGDREKSFGLSQIHLPAGHTWQGKTVTKEMATDPDIAIEFMSYHFSQGNQHWWSCY